MHSIISQQQIIYCLVLLLPSKVAQAEPADSADAASATREALTISKECTGLSGGLCVYGKRLFRTDERATTLKTAGILLLIVGLLMTLYAGFAYVTREKVVDFGELEITKENQHTVNWQPYVRIGTMVIGGVVLILGRKKSMIT